MKPLLYVAVSAFFFFSLSGCQKSAINDSVPFGERGKSDSLRTSLAAGDSAYNQLGYCLGYSGSSDEGSIGLSLNNSAWDQQFNEEVSIQRAFYSGIPASIYILYEPSENEKNAYATTDGRILFGYYMFYYIVNNYGALPVAGVLAHEWGHRVQFTYNWSEYSEPYQKELEADAFSGYYMALEKQYAWSQIQSYYKNIYAFGDYNYNDPNHHGTPDQRIQAAYLGVNTAISAMQNNTRYSYAQLHQAFLNGIKTNIATSQQKDLPEINYPNVNKSDIPKLYPGN